MLSYVLGYIELRVGIPVQESQFQGGITSLCRRVNNLHKIIAGYKKPVELLLLEHTSSFLLYMFTMFTNLFLICTTVVLNK